MVLRPKPRKQAHTLSNFLRARKLTKVWIKVLKTLRIKIDKSLQDAKELNEKIEEAEKSAKSKKALDWQDKKLLEEILEKKDELEKEINRLKELN